MTYLAYRIGNDENIRHRRSEVPVPSNPSSRFNVELSMGLLLIGKRRRLGVFKPRFMNIFIYHLKLSRCSPVNSLKRGEFFKGNSTTSPFVAVQLRLHLVYKSQITFRDHLRVSGTGCHLLAHDRLSQKN